VFGVTVPPLLMKLVQVMVELEATNEPEFVMVEAAKENPPGLKVPLTAKPLTATDALAWALLVNNVSVAEFKTENPPEPEAAWKFIVGHWPTQEQSRNNKDPLIVGDCQKFRVELDE